MIDEPQAASDTLLRTKMIVKIKGTLFHLQQGNISPEMAGQLLQNDLYNLGVLEEIYDENNNNNL